MPQRENAEQRRVDRSDETDEVTPKAAETRAVGARRRRRRDPRRDRHRARGERGGLRRSPSCRRAGSERTPGPARSLPGDRLVLVRRLPGRPPSRPAPDPVVRGGSSRPRPPRHDHRGAAHGWRRGDGGRPPRHHGQPHRPARHREGLRRRRVLGHRHRRHRRTRRGARPDLPGRARALREDRGPAAVPRRQGQPARLDAPQQPRPGDAGTRRRAALRGLRRAARDRAGSSPTTSPAAATRSTTSTPSARARRSPAAR